MLKIIVCGSRTWNDRGWITQVLSAVKSNLGTFTVIEGEATGADTIARQVAVNVLNLPVEQVPADWNKYGRGAGPIRNKEMLIGHKADGVLAFHLNLQHSKGTANMISQALAAGKPVWICTQGEGPLMTFLAQLKGIENAKADRLA